MKGFRILKPIILSFIPTENGWRPNWRLQRTPTSSERIIWPRTMFDLEKMFKLNWDLLILFETIRELNSKWLTLIEGPSNLVEIFWELLKFISEKIFEHYPAFQFDKLKSHKYFWVKVPTRQAPIPKKIFSYFRILNYPNFNPKNIWV